MKNINREKLIKKCLKIELELNSEIFSEEVNNKLLKGSVIKFLNERTNDELLQILKVDRLTKKCNKMRKELLNSISPLSMYM